MELLKLLNASEILIQTASFLVLLLILRIFAWKNILNVIEQRRARIAKEFNDIEQAKNDVELVKQDYSAKLEKIEDEAKKRINAGIEEGHKLADEIRANAHDQANNIIAETRKNIAYEIKKAQEQVKDQIIDLAMGAAERLVSEKLNQEGDRKIVEDFIDNIDNIDETK